MSASPLPPLQIKVTAITPEDPYVALWHARQIARFLNQYPSGGYDTIDQQHDDESVGVLVEFPNYCLSLLVRATTTTALLKQWDRELRDSMKGKGK